MTPNTGYHYTATLPDRLVRDGFLRYHIVVTEKGVRHTYPSGLEGGPGDWDFYDETPWQVRVVPKTTPITLFDAATDTDQLNRVYLPGSRLATTDPEDKNSAPVYDYSMRYNFRPKVAGRRPELAGFTNLVLHGRALNDTPCPVQLALIARDGSVYGGTITIDPKTGRYVLPLSQLKPVKLVSLPRPYPSFLPYFVDTNTNSGQFDPSAIETIQVSIGPGIPAPELPQKQGLAINRVTLEK